MLDTTVITLSIKTKPIFPDKCILCHAKPNSTTKTMHNSPYGWMAFIFHYLKIFKWTQIEVPICRLCKIKFHFHAWGRDAIFILLVLLIVCLLIPFYHDWDRIAQKIANYSIIPIVSIPYTIFDHFLARIFNFTEQIDSIEYEFESSEYADEFNFINSNKIPTNNDKNDIGENDETLVDSSKQMEKQVDLFVFGNSNLSLESVSKQDFSEQEEAFYPRIIEILKDSNIKERLVSIEGTNNETAPLLRICELLELKNTPPPEVLKLLTPFFSSENEEIRKRIISIVGANATEDEIPLLRKALIDENKSVRNFALNGILCAVDLGKITGNTSEKYFLLIADLWSGDSDDFEDDKIPLLLLKLNQARGINKLLSKSIFTTKFAPLWCVLKAFNEMQIEIPRHQILKIISDIELLPKNYPYDLILKESLIHLGNYRIASDLQILKGFLECPDETIADGAIFGLYRFHQFYEKIRQPMDALNTFGWDGITVAEKYICALEMLKIQLKDGGFSRYYFSEAGNQWKIALSGLHAIHAKEHHKIMEETTAKFPNGTPNPHLESRSTQLTKILLKSEAFIEQDNSWAQLTNAKLNLLIFKLNMANTKNREK